MQNIGWWPAGQSDPDSGGLGLKSDYTKMMFKKCKNLFRQARCHGLDYLLNAVSWRLPDWLFYYNHSYLLKVDNLKVFSREYTSYYKKFISEDDLELLEKNNFPRELVSSRLEAGDRGVIMGKGDEVTAIIWAASGKKFLKFYGSILDPGKNGVIFYGAHTEEYARLKGLFPSIISKLYNTYLSEGRFRIYANINILNINSLNIHKRMNFKIVGETIYISIFGINVCFYKRWPFATKRFKFFIKKPPLGLHWI